MTKREEILRKAVEFYADESNHMRRLGGPDDNKGDKARAALKEADEIKE